MMSLDLREEAFEELDERDPLAHVRDAFDLPDALIYLDGNSLGAMPRDTSARLTRCVREQWGRSLNRGWSEHGWLELPLTLGDKIAPLLGAGAGEVAVADSTSVNLFKLLCAACGLRPERRTILTEKRNFPSDLYIAQGVERITAGRNRLKSVSRDELCDAIDEDTAVLMLTHVDFRTGSLHDMESLSKAAAAKGALVIWDLSHSAGVYPLSLNRCGVDFAVGCGYKYLNGGPGAPAYLFVARRLQEQLSQPLSGWLGHAAPFSFEDTYRPAPGIARHLCGTPPVFGLVSLEAGVDILRKEDMALVRQKSSALTAAFIRLVQQRCAGSDFQLLSPSDDARRGSQVSLSHPNAEALIAALSARGVVGDFRAPNILRFGFAPIYLRYTEVWRAVQVLQETLS